MEQKLIFSIKNMIKELLYSYIKYKNNLFSKDIIQAHLIKIELVNLYFYFYK